jgi:hypothetical protein
MNPATQRADSGAQPKEPCMKILLPFHVPADVPAGKTIARGALPNGAHYELRCDEAKRALYLVGTGKTRAVHLSELYAAIDNADPEAEPQPKPGHAVVSINPELRPDGPSLITLIEHEDGSSISHAENGWCVARVRDGQTLTVAVPDLAAALHVAAAPKLKASTRAPGRGGRRKTPARTRKHAGAKARRRKS